MPVLLGLGIGLYFSLPSEPHVLTALAPPLAIVLALLPAAPRRMGVMLALTALAAASVGFALAKLRDEWVRAPVLAKQMSSVEARGYVELVEPKATRGQRVTLRVRSMGDLPPEGRPYRVRVSTGKTTSGLQAGSTVHMRATLMPPAEPALPGDYDFGRQAWFERLGGLGYTWTAAEPDASAPTPPLDLRAWAVVERLRDGIAQRVTAVHPGQTGALAVALITGARGGITDATNKCLPRLRVATHSVDFGPTHGSDGGGRVLPRAAHSCGFSLARAGLSDQEMVGRRGDGGNARLPDDLGLVVRHRALRHHDRDHVPRRHPRPARAGAAQRGTGGGAHPRHFP